MDACEIANFLANELFMQQPASLDAIHSGVPTTTTSTLTPTTLRNIEQTFLELTSDTSNTVPCRAGFVPPLLTFQFEPESQDPSLGSMGTNSSESWHTSSKQDSSIDESLTDISTVKEEEEKRRIRRERNKLAAARCRKRRVDHTMELEGKVQVLQNDKLKLQREIQKQ